ncbi:PLP-dependent aminotransferase family protein [Mangrovibacillus cuniculi]|uniref:PLP-dependent aminotransferase family protein n=1 Tax=Mangrovibacillus cuniculi TaxID=2593652 RepID=A0A7S8CD82_9BACI|nr:PLP-dependent aminotransferase family protein [Mangrovibacillus cuniculi]QPC47849.1 PLP-dependent aminotransferase family protein [Mangrovibacillus cuniculi]
MNTSLLFSTSTKLALKNDPPGEWMPNVPDGAIRLSSGFPYPLVVPVAELQSAVNRLVEKEWDLPLHYVGSEKSDLLQQQLQVRSAVRGMKVASSELLVTSGACQALDLLARVFLDEHSVVIVESPTYMEALEIFRNYTSHIISIPVDEDGIQTDLIEEVLRERMTTGLAMPKFVYTIPTFQNPTGTTMSMERRVSLLELAKRFGFIVVEDDAYGELFFEEAFPTLKSLDEDGVVVYVGSLSKLVAPGLRIGWIAASEEIVSAAYWFKKDLDHPFAQAVMATYLEEVDFGDHVVRLRDVYARKLDVMLEALAEWMPDSVTWGVPSGGYFVWVRVPGVDTAGVLKAALEAGVSFIPGKYFYLDGEDGREYLRLSFSYMSEAKIVEGVRLLGDVLGLLQITE